MDGSKKYPGIQKEIIELRRELNSIVNSEVMNSEKVLELSRELDVLILGYYKQNGKIAESY